MLQQSTEGTGQSTTQSLYQPPGTPQRPDIQASAAILYSPTCLRVIPTLHGNYMFTCNLPAAAAAASAARAVRCHIIDERLWETSITSQLRATTNSQASRTVTGEAAPRKVTGPTSNCDSDAAVSLSSPHLPPPPTYIDAKGSQHSSHCHPASAKVCSSIPLHSNAW